MNSLSTTLLTVSVLFVLGVSCLSLEVAAQTNPAAPSPEQQPCLENARLGRPVLKRREPASETTNQSEGNKSQTAENRNCVSTNAEGSQPGQQPVDCDNCAPQKPVPDVTNKGKPITMSVKFAGSHFTGEADVLKWGRETLPSDHLPDAEEINKGAATLKQLFQDVGFNDARVEIINDEGTRSITLEVNEGAPFPISEVRFEGNRVFSSQELADKIGKCLAHSQRSDYNGYDQSRFEACKQDLVTFVRSRGYLQAKLAEPKKAAFGNGIVLTIPIEEGMLYRIGEVRIEPSLTAQGEEVLMSKLPLHRGDIADGYKLGKWVYEDLKTHYDELGFIEYTAEINPTFKDNPRDPREGIVDIEVTLEEGRRFRLGSIKFEGGDLPEEELRSLFLIRPGEVFNQRLFAESINKLNETGLFYFVDKHRDSDFKTNEEQGLGSIVIKLQRRKD